MCTVTHQTWLNHFKAGGNKKYATVIKELAGLALFQVEMIKHAKTLERSNEKVKGTWVPWRDLRPKTPPGSVRNF